MQHRKAMQLRPNVQRHFQRIARVKVSARLRHLDPFHDLSDDRRFARGESFRIHAFNMSLEYEARVEAGGFIECELHIGSRATLEPLDGIAGLDCCDSFLPFGKRLLSHGFKKVLLVVEVTIDRHGSDSYRIAHRAQAEAIDAIAFEFQQGLLENLVFGIHVYTVYVETVAKQVDVAMRIKRPTKCCAVDVNFRRISQRQLYR